MIDSLEAYFPECQRINCDRVNTKHSDILPHQKELIESPERYICMVGGFGSAKTISASVLGVLLSQTVPGNIGYVVRRSYPKLRDSTQRSFLDTLQRVGLNFREREVRDGWPHRIILPNASEVFFRETKDTGRWLGPECGWFYIDEAAEEPKQTFTDLSSRLRLASARRYLKGFITTNPPNHVHWIPEIFGTAPGVITRTIEENGQLLETKYRLLRVSTRENPFLPATYIADLRAVNSEAEVKRIIEGHYGFSNDGPSVYMPPFNYDLHVAELPIAPVTLCRSWDFGYRFPAVTWHQFPQCRFGKVHWRTLREYLGQNLEANDLASIVRERTARWFPLQYEAGAIVDVGDAAGAAISDKGPGPIIKLRQSHGLYFKYKYMPNIDPGISLIRETLGKPICKCGLPFYLIDVSCKHTIDGFAGGYHYRKDKPGTENKEKPIKDGFYDNPMDTVRYAAMNVYEQLSIDPQLIETLMKDNISLIQGAPSLSSGSWDWMEKFK